ncbi:hypothetical protein ALQ04_03272 [Pseudomonas cichorii]|uniref:Transposase n=1 Tax=Pseudomonas cichorii TaxID=36746 RepID=A0A3M4M3W6_PSECI|nr:hypothetical protein ALQ04_03272 [Pseudomonas cichorii]
MSTEMSLHVLAYNLKCVLRLLGSEALMAAMKACGLFNIAITASNGPRSASANQYQQH